MTRKTEKVFSVMGFYYADLQEGARLQFAKRKEKNYELF